MKIGLVSNGAETLGEAVKHVLTGEGFSVEEILHDSNNFERAAMAGYDAYLLINPAHHTAALAAGLAEGLGRHILALGGKELRHLLPKSAHWADSLGDLKGLAHRIWHSIAGKPDRLTADELAKRCSCASAISWFKVTYPKGVDLSGWDLAMQLDALEKGGQRWLAAGVRLGLIEWVSMKGKDLSKMALDQARLDGTDLEGARLRQIKGAHLSGANLKDADLAGAIAEGTCLRKALLKRADLSGGVMSGMIASGANGQAANFKSVTASGSDFSGAELQGADFTFADLSNSDFRNTRLAATNPASGAKALTAAVFTSANLMNTDFRGSDLVRGQLSQAQLSQIVIEPERRAFLACLSEEVE